MSSNKRFTYSALLLICAIFLIGIWRLFGLTFEFGKIYPAYSSLRADPLGAKGLYESLNAIKTLEVSRNYESFSKLAEGKNRTLIFLGLNASDLEQTPLKIVERLDRFANEGGRLVFAFGPVRNRPLEVTPEPKNRKKESARKKGEEEEEEEEKQGRNPWKEDERSDCPEEGCESVSLAKHWDLEIAFGEKLKEGEEPYALRQVKSRLPGKISWHSILYFDKIDKPWKVLYASRDKAVIMEKPYGQGSIVMAADSYLFSNEAMRKERSPELLLWFFGPHAKLIFEETHLGIVKSEGIANLVRRHRMQWFLIGFLLMAALFIWKQMAPFIPAHGGPAQAREENVSLGRDYISGLISLLRRNINRQNILKTCWREWSTCSLQKTSREKTEEIEAIIFRPDSGFKNEADPVQKYRAIQRILSQRRKA